MKPNETFADRSTASFEPATGHTCRGARRVIMVATTIAVMASTLAPNLAFAQPAPTSPASPTPAPTPSAAPPSPPSDKAEGAKAAEVHFQRARQLYEEGDFNLALVEFKRAYEVSPSYRVLYNIAQVNIQLFNYAAARVALERFLKDGGKDISDTKRGQAEADLRMLRDRTAFLQVTTKPAGADVTVDDMPVGHAPFEEPLLVNAGQRKVIVSRAGYVSATRFVTLAGGDRSDLNVELTAVPEGPKPIYVAPTSTPTTTTHANYTPAIIGWVATGALAVSTAIVGGLYLSEESKIRDLSDPNKERSTPVTREAADDAMASADRLAIAADILGIATVGAGLVSLYFTFRPPKVETTTSAASVRVRPTVNGFAGTF